ncbi:MULTISPECIES: hypothetical protein [Bacteroides]|uniref:hypothetical protein n=1 Tax=Bacteroides TaxID=816 RepID=UPI001C37A742|nr:hypothetical protein [Bacteroides cellulosilyticus]MBV3636209.1 hypothetical protein [Bacteroides cellulosilyticus]MBV3662429.1 hypothetical protein [Bacteroides cellulosilyticus]MBV3684507.1 hypothetical protein [Bacteroides cellulosilyticus]MBV3693211.1 hypothetical protein [Bacteroides cellulosilyticus]MBV3706698.1 hypothetical protein [Bacteroides cellulosilyticus]
MVKISCFKSFDLYRTKPYLFNKVDIKVDFHTHLSRFGDNDRLRPSTISGDIGYKERLLKNNPWMKFIIVTNPKTFEY